MHQRAHSSSLEAVYMGLHLHEPIVTMPILFF